MDKEQLLKLGVPAESIDAILTAVASAGNDKNKSIDEASGLEIKQLKQQLTLRDKQIKALKGFEGDANELKSQVEELQKANKELSDSHKNELAVISKTHAIKQALMGSQSIPHDVDLTLNQFDLDSIQINKSGEIIGLKEQLSHLVESKPFLFKEQKAEQVRGWNLHQSHQKESNKAQENEPQAGSIGEMMAEQVLQFTRANKEA